MSEYDSELSKIVAELNRPRPATSRRRACRTRPPRSTSCSRLPPPRRFRCLVDRRGSRCAARQWRAGARLRAAARSRRRAQSGAAAAGAAATRRAAEKTAPRISASYGGGPGPLRVNLHHQRGTLAASIRLLPARIPSLDRCTCRRRWPNSPSGARAWCWSPEPPLRQTCTLAALIDIVNSRRRHVVTSRTRSISARQRSSIHRADRSRPRHTGFAGTCAASCARRPT